MLYRLLPWLVFVSIFGFIVFLFMPQKPLLKTNDGKIIEFEFNSIKGNVLTGYQKDTTELLKIPLESVDIEFIKSKNTDLHQKIIEEKRKANQILKDSNLKLVDGTLLIFEPREVSKDRLTGYMDKDITLLTFEWDKIDVGWLETNNKFLYSRMLAAKRQPVEEKKQDLITLKLSDGTTTEIEVKEVNHDALSGFPKNATSLTKMSWDKIDLVALQVNHPVLYSKYAYAKRIYEEHNPVKTKLKLANGEVVSINIKRLNATEIITALDKNTEKNISWRDLDVLWLEKEQPELFKQMIALNPKNIVSVKGMNGKVLSFEITSLDAKGFKGYKEGGLDVVTVNWDMVDLKWLEANQNETFLKYREAQRLLMEQEKNGPLPLAITLVKKYLSGLNANNPDLMEILADGKVDARDEIKDFFYYDRRSSVFTSSVTLLVTQIDAITNSGTNEEVKRIKSHLATISEFAPKLFSRVKSTTTTSSFKASLDSNARFKVKFALDALAGMIKNYENSSKKE